MDKSHLKLVTRAPENRTVATPKRPEQRPANPGIPHQGRAAHGGRPGATDTATLAQPARHREQAGKIYHPATKDRPHCTTLHVRRANQGTPATHPILGDELRALRRLKREQQPKSPFVFASERAAPFTTAGFARMIERAASRRNSASRLTPHMLRHACGYALDNKGHNTRALQAYLGHKNIQHTVR